MEHAQTGLSGEELQRATRGFGILAWAFVFLLYIGIPWTLGPIRIVLPPPTLGWLMIVWAIWLLPQSPELRAAVTWALGALVLSVLAGFVVESADNSYRWYRVLRTAALPANYLVGAGAVFGLMSFCRRFAREAGARELAQAAPLRAWLYLASAVMPLTAMLLQRALDGTPVWLAFLPAFVSVVAITALVSYAGAFVRLCTTARKRPRQTETRPAAEHEAVEELWSEESETAVEQPETDRGPSNDDGP